MICCRCKRPISRSYGRVTDIGNYCRDCAMQNEINTKKTILDKMKQIQTEACKETARESLEEFICKLINLKLITTTEDFYYELLEVKDDLLKEKFGVDLGEKV